MGYYGVLTQGKFASACFSDNGKLPSHYFSGAIYSTEFEGKAFEKLLREKIQKHKMQMFLPILPTNLNLACELTYFITDYHSPDTPRTAKNITRSISPIAVEIKLSPPPKRKRETSPDDEVSCISLFFKASGSLPPLKKNKMNFFNMSDAIAQQNNEKQINPDGNSLLAVAR